MGNSGVPWIDAIFDWCVILLANIAKALGTSYELVNIVLFCVLWPVLTVGLVAAVWWQRRTIRRLRVQPGTDGRA